MIDKHDNSTNYSDIFPTPINIPRGGQTIKPDEITLKVTLPQHIQQSDLVARYNMFSCEVTPIDRKEIAYCSLWYRGHLLTAMPLNPKPLPDCSFLNHHSKNIDSITQQIEHFIELTFEKLGIKRQKELFHQLNRDPKEFKVDLPDFLTK